MKSFCVLGLGRFGQTLALTLAQAGNQVLIVDEDADDINVLADAVTNAVIGDPTNEAVLRAAGVQDYDCAVVCTAKNINDNILLTIMLKEMGLKVVARALNEGHKRVLERLGTDLIVYPEQDMGEKLAYMLARDRVIQSLEFSGGARMVEMQIPPSWVGRNLIELSLRHREKVNVVAVRPHGGKLDCAPSPTRPFAADDTVTIIGAEEDVDRVTEKK